MAEVNQRISEYVLDQLIGQTPLAQVFKAHHHMWAEQIVAVKVPTDAVYVQNLRQAGVRLHLLAHANIVRAIGFDPTAAPPYLITEFVAGGNLRPLIGVGKLTVAAVVNILRQVLSGLQHAHEKGVVHGDIKPENILLEADAQAGGFALAGCVKISDFGVGATAAATALRAGSETGKAVMLEYLAPEQREGKAADPRSDIYSLGVMMFELLTGERPSGLELPSEINPAVPKSLDEVFRRCYARHERRFASVRQLLEALPDDSAAAASKVVSPAAAPPAPEPEPSIPEPPVAGNSLDDTGIEMAGEDSAQVVAPVVEDAVLGFRQDADEHAALAGETNQELPLADEVEENPPRTDIDLSPPPAPGDTYVPPADEPADSPYPALPKLSRHPSRADEKALFDELQNKQVRSGADVKGVFRQLNLSRPLDQEETANIRIRLLRWANSLAGEDAVLDEQLEVNSAKSWPVYLVALRSRMKKSGGEVEDVRFNRVANSAIEDDARSAIAPGDYHVLVHLSAREIEPALLQHLPPESLRAAILDLIAEVKTALDFPKVRQDVLVFCASAIVVDYQFDQQAYRTLLLGDQLTVFGGENPFQAIGEDPTKRAAALMDGADCRKGIGPLRRSLQSDRWHERATTIMAAFRGKLAAAYMHEAKAQFSHLGWLESLDTCGKAGLLVPGNNNALQHAARVRKAVRRLHLLPGLIMMLIFLAITVTRVIGGAPSFQFKEIMRLIVSQPFFYAALGAMLTSLISRVKLGTRLAHTDITFYHAMVLPLAVAGILSLAPDRFANATGDAVCAVLLLVVIVTDAMIFRYFPHLLYRQQLEDQLAGDPAAALSRIESLLEHDWEQLQPHYVGLGPLYRFSGAQRDIESVQPAAKGNAPPPPPSPVEIEEPISPADETSMVVAEDDAEPAPVPVTGDPAADQLLTQFNNRIGAGLRALAPPARMLVTLVVEYEKMVRNRQLGMMQTNATKIEQKGNDLAKKLGELDALSKSPLTLDSRESPQLRLAHEQIAQKARSQDVQVLAALAKQAQAFREDQTTALTQLRTQLAQVQRIVEKLKKM